MSGFDTDPEMQIIFMPGDYEEPDFDEGELDDAEQTAEED